MKNIEELLKAINWDFSASNTRKSIHSIHPYPAKFIPEIPSALMDILPIKENTKILDPFCGSGTTLVEAQKRGIDSVGVDLNPIATLISKVKTTNLPSEFLYTAEQCITIAKSKKEYEIKYIPNLNHWFKAEIQEALSALIKEIDNVTHVDVKDALKLALSSIIVRVSNQESDTRYAAIDKNITKDDVFKLFYNSCKNFQQSLAGDLFANSAHSEIINQNILEVKPEEIKGKIGLVITSPPYPNAYEYWLYHKYRMFWLGYDPVSVKKKEIGSRSHYFKKNHQTIDDFINQMDKTLSLLKEVVVPSGYICFVVGRSKIHGVEYDNGKIIEELAVENDISVVTVIDRNIAMGRKSFNLSHAKIKKETIVILQIKEN